MPIQNQKTVHHNVMLTNISVAFQQNTDFVFDKVFPEVLVDKRSNKYWVYDPESYNRDDMKPRAPSTESAGIKSRLSDDNYYCDNYALHEDISDEELDNADDQFDLKADATELLSHKAMINKENKWHESYFKTAVWAADVDVTAAAHFGGVALSDSGSLFIEGMKKEIEDQKLRSHGFKPNTLVLSADVWRILSDHVQFLDRVIGGATTTLPAHVMKDHLAAILGLDSILVSEAILNTAAEGQTPSNQFFASNGALLCYVAQRMGRKTPTAGATFTWRRATKGLNKGTTIRDFKMQKVQATRVEIEQNFDYKVIAPEMGTFLHNIL